MDRRWPDNSDSYVTAAQIAARLGYRTMKAFYAARPALDLRGFPAPALPRRWRASQVERWEAWNADRASAGATFTPANDAPRPARMPAPSPVPPTSQPALQRLAEIRRAAGLAN
jgi:hypothetical protein